MGEKTTFLQSYGNIDIWFDENTTNGVTKYIFWFRGKTYERPTKEEIIALAKELYNSYIREVNSKKR